MKYYAVTNDPNELAHYGRLGMKWGQHIFGGQKSAAYKRASSKLSQSMRNGIASKKSSWRKSPSPAVLRAKAKAKAAKKEAKAFRKEQKFMDKAVQRAREGRLKYGKLSDDQVRRVTERLALEQRARQLGSTEKPKFKTRLKNAVQEGMLRGAAAGGAAYIEEQWRAKGRVAASKKYGKKLAKIEARDQAYKNKYLDKDNAKRQAKKERAEEKKEAKRAEELSREAYEYGAVFDNKGRLDYKNNKALGEYYNRKYLTGKSRSQETAEQKKAEAKQKAEYAKTVKRLEAKQKAEERQRKREADQNERRLRLEAQKRLQAADEKERERYRQGMEKLNAAASKRDAERAWESRERRIDVRNASARAILDYRYGARTAPYSGGNSRKRKGVNRPYYRARRK